MFKDGLLFSKEDFNTLIKARESKIRDRISKWDMNKILQEEEAELIAFLMTQNRFNLPRLLRDKTYIKNQDEVQINVSHQSGLVFGEENLDNAQGRNVTVTVAVPFEGNADLFGYQFALFKLTLPHGRVEGREILMTFESVKIDSEKVRRVIDSNIDKIEECLEEMKGICDKLNERVNEIAKNCIRARKQHHQAVENLGFPMKRPD